MSYLIFVPRWNDVARDDRGRPVFLPSEKDAESLARAARLRDAVVVLSQRDCGLSARAQYRQMIGARA